MDDLLKVFFWETSECIAACWLAADRLRQVPDDADSFEDMLEQFRTMRETSRFLGMSALQAAAGTVLESLESARANRPESMDRMVSLAVDGLKRIEAVVKGMMIADAAMAEEAPLVRPTAAASAAPAMAKPGQMSGARGRSGGAASRRADSQKRKVEPEQQEAPQAASVLAPNNSIAADLVPTPVAASVEAGSDTLGTLLSLVQRLATTQDEILQRLRQLELRQSGRPEPASPASARQAQVLPMREAVPLIAPAAVAKPSEPDEATRSRHLLFTSGDGSHRAVRCDRVEGVEQLDLDAIDNDRGLWITRWNGSPLPLIPVDPDYQLSTGGRSAVIIFRIGGQKFGLLIGAAPEISEVESPTDASGNPVPVIEPSVYFEQFIRGRFQRRRRKPAKSLQAADTVRAAIPADDDLFVRKSSR